MRRLKGLMGEGKEHDVEFKHSNGSRVKSKTTGLEGVIVARADHLYGCNRYFVQPPVDKDGKVQDGYWCDEDDLEVLNEKEVEAKSTNKGGFPSKVK